MTVISKFIRHPDCLVAEFNRCFTLAENKLRMMLPGTHKMHKEWNHVLEDSGPKRSEGWWKSNHCKLPARSAVSKSEMGIQVKRMRFRISSGTAIMRLLLAQKSSCKSQVFKRVDPLERVPQIATEITEGLRVPA